MPTTKERVWKKLVDMNSTHMSDAGNHGVLAGQKALQRLRDKARKDKEEFSEGLETIVSATGSSEPLAAIKLQQLLKKRWSEQQNAYKIKSRIRTQKDERRLMRLLSDP